MSFHIVQLLLLTSKRLLSQVAIALTAIGDSRAALRMTKAAMSVARKGLASTAALTAKAGLTAQTLLLDQPANELMQSMQSTSPRTKRYLRCPLKIK